MSIHVVSIYEVSLSTRIKYVAPEF